MDSNIVTVLPTTIQTVDVTDFDSVTELTNLLTGQKNDFFITSDAVTSICQYLYPQFSAEGTADYSDPKKDDLFYLIDPDSGGCSVHRVL